MNSRPILLAVLAASFLLVGAAGAVSAQPDDRADNATEAGPSDDLPDGPPEFVSDLQTTIDEFLAGDIDNLGAAVSELTPGEDADADNASENTDERNDRDDNANERDDDRDDNANERDENADDRDDGDADGDA